MKIVHIIPLLGCGGAEVLLGDIVRQQVESGHDIIICCLHPFHSSFDNYPNKQFLLERVQIRFIHTRVHFSLKGKTKILGNDYQELLDAFKPDIIHSHLYEAELVAMSYHVDGAKYISHIHDNIVQFEKFKIKDIRSKKRLATLKERSWLLGRYAIVKPFFICISKDVLQYVKLNLPASLCHKCIFLPNAINLSRFKGPLLRDFSMLKIVSVGNLVKKKNHRLLLDIALILKNKLGDNFQIDILGFGPLFTELNELIKINHLEQNVFLRGSVGNVDEYYRNANVYVHTATYEPFGLVLIEAMSTGLFVISLDGKGNRDIIHSYENGILLKDNNAEVFVEAILSTFDDHSLYSRVSENSIKFSQNFDINNYMLKLHHQYTL